LVYQKLQKSKKSYFPPCLGEALMRETLIKSIIF
jgi:hypothetical protein